ncbi:hypothetical protein H4S14_003444 [Agrobacterium vitis]|nr:hypothetical protein [Agrobacterium vitis]MBE1439679.1 hypothetical protein [Agrobacterium vitis]
MQMTMHGDFPFRNVFETSGLPSDKRSPQRIIKLTSLVFVCLIRKTGGHFFLTNSRIGFYHLRDKGHHTGFSGAVFSSQVVDEE